MTTLVREGRRDCEAVLRRPPRHVALMLIDVINALDFEGSAGIVRQQSERRRASSDSHDELAPERPRDLRERQLRKWRSDFQSTVRACSAPEQPGSRVTLRLRPHEDDYFVLKPQHSAFYCTRSSSSSPTWGFTRSSSPGSPPIIASCSRPTTRTCGGSAWWSRRIAPAPTIRA